MPDRQLAEFIAEADERTETIRRGLEALRASLDDGRARRGLLAAIFHEAHTLKGSAAAHGLEALAELAHEFESLLDAVRRARVPAAAALDLFDEAAETVAAHLLRARRGEPPADSPGEASAAPSGHPARPGPGTLVERLRAASRLAGDADADEAPWPGAEAALPFEVEKALGGAERARLREAAAEGARVFVVLAEFDASDFDVRFRELGAALAEAGEVIATLPGFRAGAPTRVVFRIVYATREGREALLARVASFGASLDERDAPSDSGGALDEPAELVGLAEAAEAEQLAARLAGAGRGDGPPVPDTVPLLSVRVPLDELDELIASAHDLFRETLAALEASGGSSAAAAHAPPAAPPARDPASGAAERIGRVRRRFSEFEERLIGLRLVALGPVMEVAAWAGRAAARAAGREVEFELRGGDVRVDKSLAEAVAGPLLHLARNAAAHGVETPEERLRLNKPARGRVRVEAAAEGSRVSLRVADDGRGVDADRIGRVAAARGLVPPGTTLGEEAALRLIFAPGFSTADEVTGAAGRGVGLEAVERAVERAGGEVRVRTEAGRGASFELILPARLALVPALVVRADGELYCLDSRGVTAVVQSAGAQSPGGPDRARPHGDGGPLAADNSGELSIAWRGQSLPVLHLSRLLGRQAEAAAAGRADPRPFVVARAAAGGAPAAVAFDELLGREEVLARGLGRHAARWRGVSGATELRGGGVALVLDLPRLLSACG